MARKVINFPLLTIVTLILVLHRVRSDPAQRKKDGKYTTRYDNFNVAGVLASDRLVKSYGDCLLDRGPCTNEGRYLREIVPDAITTECSKCNAIQKKRAGEVLQHLLLKHRALFIELGNRYDPDGSARKKYGLDEKQTVEEDYSEYEDA